MHPPDEVVRPRRVLHDARDVDRAAHVNVHLLLANDLGGGN